MLWFFSFLYLVLLLFVQAKASPTTSSVKDYASTCPKWLNDHEHPYKSGYLKSTSASEQSEEEVSCLTILISDSYAITNKSCLSESLNEYEIEFGVDNLKTSIQEIFVDPLDNFNPLVLLKLTSSIPFSKEKEFIPLYELVVVNSQLNEKDWISSIEFNRMGAIVTKQKNIPTLVGIHVQHNLKPIPVSPYSSFINEKLLGNAKYTKRTKKAIKKFKRLQRLKLGKKILKVTGFAILCGAAGFAAGFLMPLATSAAFALSATAFLWLCISSGSLMGVIAAVLGGVDYANKHS